MIWLCIVKWLFGWWFIGVVSNLMLYKVQRWVIKPDDVIPLCGYSWGGPIWSIILLMELLTMLTQSIANKLISVEREFDNKSSKYTEKIAKVLNKVLKLEVNDE